MEWLLKGYRFSVFCCFFFFSFFFSANRRSHHLPSEKTFHLQPCFALWWFQLYYRYWNHSHHHLCQGRPQWRSALSDGLLLHLSSYISQVCGNPPFCHSNRNITGHTSWASRHSFIQKSHGRVERFYWELVVLRTASNLRNIWSGRESWICVQGI